MTKSVKNEAPLAQTSEAAATALHLIVLPTLAHTETTLRNLKTIMSDSWSKVQTVLDITGLWLTARQRDEDKDDG